MLVALTLVKLAAPGLCSCRAKVPVPLMFTSEKLTPLVLPSMKWMAE